MFKWWVLIFVFSVSCNAPKLVDYEGWGGREKVTHVVSENEVNIFQEINIIQHRDSSLCIDDKPKKVTQSAFKFEIQNTVKHVNIVPRNKLRKANSLQKKPDLSKYFISYNMLMDLGALFLIVGFTVLGVLGGLVGTTSATINSDSTIAIIFIPCLILIGIGFLFWFAGLFYFNHFQKDKKKK
jgi:hypothetical protein